MQYLDQHMNCNNNHGSITSDQQKSVLFNAYFHSVYGEFEDPESITDETENPQSDLSASLTPVSFDESDVCNALRSLDPNKAKGIDGKKPWVSRKHIIFYMWSSPPSIQQLTNNYKNSFGVAFPSTVFKSGNRADYKTNLVATNSI